MPTRRVFLRHIFDGGYATDRGPLNDAPPDANGLIAIPWLTAAENVIYLLNRGIRKAPGTVKINSSELESGAVVKGVFDAWFTGTGGSPSQHRIVHVGTTCKKDDADGTFTNLFTGLQSGAVPSYEMFEDLLIISSLGSDVPRSWDGTTAQNLAGTPPNFGFCVAHQNRAWAAGDLANPSRLYYSALLDPEDWVGAGSGNIDIDPSDKDRITGLASHKGELIVFKGPYKGSIHRISGSAPTGDDPFARTPFVSGIGAVGHNTIFRFRDDIGFMTPQGSIHSLNAVTAFGDFSAASLSRDIAQYIDENFNRGQLEHAWAARYFLGDYVLFVVPTSASTTPDAMLMMDVRFDPPRWSLWTSFTDLTALAEAVDASTNNRNFIIAGSNDGFVKKMQQAARSIDGTGGIALKIETPSFTYGNAISNKTITLGGLGFNPRNSGDVSFFYQLNASREVGVSIEQGFGSAVLGSFTLDTDTLAGGIFLDEFFELEDGGEFRSIQYRVENDTAGEDVEVFTISAGIKVGGWSTEEDI